MHDDALGWRHSTQIPHGDCEFRVDRKSLRNLRIADTGQNRFLLARDQVVEDSDGSGAGFFRSSWFLVLFRGLLVDICGDERSWRVGHGAGDANEGNEFGAIEGATSE